jgi:signal transduction protein with GAF and PtsI domain
MSFYTENDRFELIDKTAGLKLANILLKFSQKYELTLNEIVTYVSTIQDKLVSPFYTETERFVILDEQITKISCECKITISDFKKYLSVMEKQQKQESQILVATEKNKNLNRPINAGKRWIPTDLVLLEKLFNKNKNIDQIAGKLGRTDIAIVAKFKEILNKNDLSPAKDMEKILETYPHLQKYKESLLR